MRKFRFTVLLFGMLLTTLSAVVHADVIVEPNNSFYERNRDESVYLNRDFYANSVEGYVSIKKEPGSNSEISAIENGTIVNIKFTLNYKGEEWGITELSVPDKDYSEWPSGWIPMEQLLVVYDYISFAEDHGSEFYDYTGSGEVLVNSEGVVFWSWPGSGRICRQPSTSR